MTHIPPLIPSYARQPTTVAWSVPCRTLKYRLTTYTAFIFVSSWPHFNSPVTFQLRMCSIKWGHRVHCGYSLFLGFVILQQHASDLFFQLPSQDSTLSVSSSFDSCSWGRFATTATNLTVWIIDAAMAFLLRTRKDHDRHLYAWGHT